MKKRKGDKTSVADVLGVMERQNLRLWAKVTVWAIISCWSVRLVSAKQLLNSFKLFRSRS